MASAFASGKSAIGECQRCGFVYKLSRLRRDGENNLLVCSDCFDEKHPAETPVNTSDAIALRNPAPDLDAENSRVLEDDTPIGTLLFGTGNYFGEQ